MCTLGSGNFLNMEEEGEAGVNCMYADGLGILMQNSIQVPILKANYVE